MIRNMAKIAADRVTITVFVSFRISIAAMVTSDALAERASRPQHTSGKSYPAGIFSGRPVGAAAIPTSAR